MRILALIVSPGHRGGAENATIELAQELKKQGIEIKVVAMVSEVVPAESQTDLEIKRVLVKRIPLLPKPYCDFLLSTKLDQEIKSGQYDLVHLFNTHPPLVLKKLAKRSQNQKIPYIFTTHGLVETTSIRKRYARNPLVSLSVKWIIEQPLKYILQHASLVTVGSDFERPILNYYGVTDQRIKVTYNGVNPKILATPASKINIQQKYQIPQDEKLILYVGNIKYNKGLEFLVKASQNLEKTKILIVGQVTQEKYYQQILALIKDQQLEDKIIFTGFVSDEELIALHQQSDIFILPTLADTFPLVILDAMASKTPVIASQVGGIPEEIDSSCGILVKPGQVEELAQAINKLLNDEQLRQQMGLAAYHKVLKKFTWQNVAKRMISFYQMII